MKSRRYGVLSWVVVALALVGLTGVGTADAKGRKKGKRGAKVTKVNSKALGQLMGRFKFGMSKKQVLKVLARELNERYAEKIKAATDIYSQDKLRKEKRRELKRIQKSFVAFKGKKTGWDVSIIDEEFAHHTGESMMVYWENVGGKDQRRFFFFHEGRLYKMFIALNSNMLKPSQRKFVYFQNIMEQRYGGGKIHSETRDGVDEPTHIAWNTRKFNVRAIDKLQFYGNFCLAISDPRIEKALEPMRAAQRKPKKKNRVIDAIISKDDDDEPGLHENDGALDGMLKN
jgi:hypothetical protein